MNAEKYTELAYLEKSNNMNFQFQQDNLPSHATKRTKKWLISKNILQLDWPSLSPDLNLMQNL